VKNYVQIGDVVADSAHGAGTITGITEAGYPQVNHVAVGWLRLEDGTTFNPFGHDIEKIIAQRAKDQSK